MGGLVAVAIRHEGNVVCQHISTARLELLFWDTELSPEAFKKAIGAGGGLPSKFFAPFDYGLVVIDFDQRWVASCQGNCNLFSAPSAYVNQDGPMMKALSKAALTTPMTLHTFAEPMGGTGQAFHHPTAVVMSNKDLKQSVDQARGRAKEDLAEKDMVPTGTWEMLSRDPPKGWKTDHFNELTQTGWTGLVQGLLERDWLPSPEEAKQWDAFLAHAAQYQGCPEVLGAAKGFEAFYREQALEERLPVPLQKHPKPRL